MQVQIYTSMRRRCIKNFSKKFLGSAPSKSRNNAGGNLDPTNAHVASSFGASELKFLMIHSFLSDLMSVL